MPNEFFISRTESAMDLPLPEYQTEQAAGMDLRANVETDAVLSAGEIKLVPTGMRIALPPGFEAQIRPRSGLAAKYGVTIVNAPGTIDADYRGEISVIMINHGKSDFIIKRGDRIAQMIISRVEHIEWSPVDELPETKRGDGGFGHTGR